MKMYFHSDIEKSFSNYKIIFVLWKSVLCTVWILFVIPTTGRLGHKVYEFKSHVDYIASMPGHSEVYNKTISQNNIKNKQVIFPIDYDKAYT